VAADADAGGLADIARRALPDGFVGQRAGARDDADFLAALGVFGGGVDVAGHDADLAFAGGDDAGAVGADEDGIRFALEELFDLDHVQDGDALGDGDDDADAGVGGFHDGVGGEGGRDEDHRGVGAGGLHRLFDGVEDGKFVGVLAAALAGGD